MSTASDTTPAVPVRVHGRTSLTLVREVWASLAVAAMWIAVAVSAVWGPDFVSTSGSSTTTIPSGVAVALFASIGTWAVAKYGFNRQEKSSE